MSTWHHERTTTPSFIERNHSLLVLAVIVAFFTVTALAQGLSPSTIVALTLVATTFLMSISVSIWINERANHPNPSRKEAQRLSVASESLRLARDCDEQAAALARGDWVLGMYGRFPTPSVLESLPPDIDEIAMAAVTGLITGTITGAKPPPDRSWIEFDRR